MNIAFQGHEGAYSHAACLDAYPDMEPVGHASFEDVFHAVESSKCDLAMIPIENSLGGRVSDIHHLLPDTTLSIIAEHFTNVKHHLLAIPGAKIEAIKTVLSHPQALAQCRKTLRDLGIAPQAFTDTAGAALEVARRQDPSQGAIASKLAGQIYGLTSLRTYIEDQIGNTTRFIVMARARKDPDPAHGDCITSFLFQMRSIPAALYKCLGGFATNGVNFIKLESYISLTGDNVSAFYAETEGHPAHRNVDQAFQELNYFASRVKILGVYRNHQFRSSASINR